MTADEKTSFIRAQWKFIIFSMIAYSFFYLTRKNLSMATPFLTDPETGLVSKETLGIFISVHGVLYGLSRFVNGFWADRLNGRIFMTVGLALSAAMNFAFGCSSWAMFFGIFWIANGWVQGMGFPPCAKMLTHWIHPKELSTKMSLWNTSHSFGSVMALGLCTCLFFLGFGWRWCFWIPAVLTLFAALFCYFFVCESPTEAGVPELQLDDVADDKPASTVTTADRRRLVFGNRVIWMIAFANFFVYIIRFGFLDWGPTFLKEFKGISVEKGGLMTIAFELAAVVGTIFAGWATDRFFKGRGVRMSVICMFFAALFAFGFWYLPKGAPIWGATLLLMGAGFCIYGPQALVGIVAANQATKEAAAMANGFVGVMGYLSTTVSGYGIAKVAHSFGWGPALCAIAGSALVGMLLFLLAWNAQATGYKKQ